MADTPISQLTEFVPLGRFLIAVVDTEASPGLKNGYITLDAFAAFISGGGGSTVSGAGQFTLDTSALDGNDTIG